MSKIYQVVTYIEINDEAAMARYAALAGPAITASGGRFISRGPPVGTQEDGKITRTVIIEWDDLGTAQRGFASVGYQKALAELGNTTKRDIRYLEALA
jgi:uncharacterized protein (DUF1330 family)